MSLFRPTLAPLEPYVPSPPQPGHRLHLNESPADLPREVKEAAARRLVELDWSRYPEETALFEQDVAHADGWRADGVVLGNGSNEMLQQLVFGTLSPGDVMLVASPSFSVYRVQAMAAGARTVDVPLRGGEDEPFRFDVDALIRAANESQARLIMLATPNNPTGTLLTADEIRRLHDGTRAALVIDEAYRHFAPSQSLVPLLAECERLLLMRTFSKSYAAAGLRLGYVLASPENARELKKLVMPYNVSAIDAVLGRELLRHGQLVEERVRHVIGERERLERAMAELDGWRVERSHANFLVLEHRTRQAKELAAELANRGVLVRDLSGYPGCGRCLRVGIGTSEANDAFLAAVREL